MALSSVTNVTKARIPGEFWDDLDTVATDLEPALRQAYVDAIRRLRETVTGRMLDDAVATNDIDQILTLLDLDALREDIRRSVETAAQHTADSALATGPRPQILIRFNVLNPYSVRALTDMQARTLLYVHEEVRAGALQFIRDGLLHGQNPRQTARALREIIGLPPRLAQATANYRRMLEESDPSALVRALRDQRSDALVRRAIDSAKPLVRADVDRLVTRYEARALQYAAETVARTESMDALHLGQRLAWRQAIDEGKVTLATVRRYWAIARSERTCEYCLPIPELNLDGRAFDEPFVTPLGLVLLPTLHPNCRCVVYHKIVES